MPQLEKTRRYVEKRRAIVESHRTHCVVCGLDDKVCLEFHHHPPLEDGHATRIAQGIRQWGYERLREELKKVVCLCANCHKRVHAGTVTLD